MDFISMVLLLCAGLIIGWWLVPQPQFMKDLYEKIFGSSYPKEPEA